MVDTFSKPKLFPEGSDDPDVAGAITWSERWARKRGLNLLEFKKVLFSMHIEGYGVKRWTLVEVRLDVEAEQGALFYYDFSAEWLQGETGGDGGRVPLFFSVSRAANQQRSRSRRGRPAPPKPSGTLHDVQCLTP